MVKLLQVAQLVHDDVVGDVWRKEQKLVTKIQIPLLGTTAPAGPRITYRHFTNLEPIMRIELRDLGMHEYPGILLVPFIIPAGVFFSNFK